MFCDGVCKKGKKQCGLLIKIYKNNGEESDACSFIHLINNTGALNNNIKRLNSVMESMRNEDVESMDRASNKLAAALGKGILTLQDETAKIKAIK